MQIPKNRQYPYPIFALGFDDYKDNALCASFEIAHNENNANLIIKTTITNNFVLEQLRTGKFALYCHMECGSTRYRHCFPVPYSFVNNKIIYEIDINSLRGDVEIILLLVSSEEFNVEATVDMDDFYKGTTIVFPHSAIVGYSESYTVYINKSNSSKHKGTTSIVVFAPGLQNEEIYNLEENQIIISLPQKEYEGIANLQGSFLRTKHAILIKPAIMYALEKIKEDITAYEDKDWYKALESACTKNGFTDGFQDTNFKETENYIIASKLLNDPSNASIWELNALLDKE